MWISICASISKHTGLELLQISKIEPIPFVVFIIQQQKVVMAYSWEHLQTFVLFAGDKLKDFHRGDALEYLMLSQYEELENPIKCDLVN